MTKLTNEVGKGRTALAIALGVLALPALAEDAVPTSAPASAEGQPAPAEGEWKFYEEYCSECHNSTDWAGGVAFDTMLPESLHDDAAVWEEAVRKLRGRLMPPPDKKQPTQQEIDRHVTWMESKLDEQGKLHPNPGNVVVHRLNRTEYQREIKNLLDLDIDASTLLPKDTKADGFDNVATVLKVSPSFLDAYIVAASEVSARAIGSANAAPSSTTYRLPDDTSQGSHIEGMPLGTRGGLLIEHLFPADGEYTFNVSQTGGGGGGYVAGLDTRHKLILTVDGRKVFEQELGGEEDLKSVDQKQAPAAKAIRDRFTNIKTHVPAGPHKIGVTFVARSLAQNDDLLEPFSMGSQLGSLPRVPVVTGLEVLGPNKTTGLADTPSRKKIFICRPANEAEEASCAKRIVGNLARNAFRRPVTDEELAAPLRFYEAGRAAKGFEVGIQQALMAVLASPKFLYRVEGVPADAPAGQDLHHRRCRARFAAFVLPVEPGTGRSAHESRHRRQAHRSRGARETGEAHARRSAREVAHDELRVSMAHGGRDRCDRARSVAVPGIRRLAAPGLPQGDRAVRRQRVLRRPERHEPARRELHVRERAARAYYGIPNVRGDRFRRVQLTDSHRFGLLGKGAFLMGMSYANRTSPVRRGAWVLEQIRARRPPLRRQAWKRSRKTRAAWRRPCASA